jgi:DNA mismatch endonuclease, patch repair protein
MSRIRGRNTATELALRKALWNSGLRYRLHQRIEGARPDIVFPRERLAVFVDGCFWHGCPEHYVRPRSRNDFWAEKLRTNVLRDHRQTIHLERDGWTILRFWEHEVACELPRISEQVKRALRADSSRRLVETSWVVAAVEPLDDQGSFERRYLQDLRDPDRVRVVERERTTRKW